MNLEDIIDVDLEELMERFPEETKKGFSLANQQLQAMGIDPDEEEINGILFEAEHTTEDLIEVVHYSIQQFHASEGKRFTSYACILKINRVLKERGTSDPDVDNFMSEYPNTLRTMLSFFSDNNF